MKPPTHLHKPGRDAFDRYLERLPDFPELAEALAEVEQLIRAAFKRMTSAKEKPDAAVQRLYLSLVDKRTALLNVAGLTPKAVKQLTGVTAPKVDPLDAEDDKFLDG